jgi:hypothetical protein
MKNGDALVTYKFKLTFELVRDKMNFRKNIGYIDLCC